MKKQTFVDNMTTRGYELKYSPLPSGNVTATKGETIVRWLRTDHEKIYVETPDIKMLIPSNVLDTETFRLLDYLVQP